MGPCGLAGLRYLTTSYKEDFVKRDARRMRDLVSSEWYRALWPQVALSRSGEISFANTATGSREGMPFASLTAGRGDRVIIDDPHSTETAESETERERTLRIYRESVTTRLNDPTRSAIVVIMQRLHERDVSSEILRLGLGYVHLMLPMEFEPDRACRTPIFADPRTLDGELLFPERFPRAVIEREGPVRRLRGGRPVPAAAGPARGRPVRPGGFWDRRRPTADREVGARLGFRRHEEAAGRRSGLDRRPKRWAAGRTSGSTSPTWCVCARRRARSARG